jgi:hypothetical protein
VLALFLGGACASASARAHRGQRHPPRPVPARFLGVNAGGPLLDPNGDVNPAQQFDLMVASGVGSVRVLFNWSAAQPYQSWSDVPAQKKSQFVDVGGVPTDFSATDQVVALATQRGLTMLPTVLYAPPWDQRQNPSGGLPPPSRVAPYASYLTALIDRYGPHGSYWHAHQPRRPIRSWQIWNEPNLTVYWTQPFARSYVALLRAAHAAIKRADRGAAVVLGAITNVAWRDLGKIYAIRGARRLFDVVAVNGFTSTPRRVIAFLRLVRHAMNRLGDRRKPVLDTEFSWPSAVGKSLEQFDWDTTEAGQARKITAALPMLAAHRSSLGLAGVFYYTWIGAEAQNSLDDFNFAGLLRYQPSDGQVVAKPALAAFKRAALALERCRQKGSVATRCVRRG